MARSQPFRPAALIVEDEHLTALDLERAMAELGYEVCLAASQSRARFLAMQRHPDIVLINVCLGREGIETGRWLRDHLRSGHVDTAHVHISGEPQNIKPGQ